MKNRNWQRLGCLWIALGVVSACGGTPDSLDDTSPITTTSGSVNTQEPTTSIPSGARASERANGHAATRESAVGPAGSTRVRPRN
jgi:hypothetical protein